MKRCSFSPSCVISNVGDSGTVFCVPGLYTGSSVLACCSCIIWTGMLKRFVKKRVQRDIKVFRDVDIFEYCV